MSRRVRIVTGIILMVFVTGHLLNLSLGVISLELLDRARPIFLAPWSNPVGKILLVGSMIVHGLFGLMAIYWRNTLRLTTSDAVQVVTALAIMPLLVPHVIGTAVALELYGFESSYAALMPYFWLRNPVEGLRQVILLAVVWVHGCIGLFIWMRVQTWWSAVGLFVYPLAVAIPVAALLGYSEAGKEAVYLAYNPPVVEAPGETAEAPAETAPDNAATSEPQAASQENTAPAEAVPAFDPAEAIRTLNEIKWATIWTYLALVLAMFIARFFRLSRSAQTVHLTYLNGPKVKNPAGVTLLEISRIHDVPHANLCRGRGRCGTCRVRVLSADHDLEPPGAIEQQTLKSVGAGPDVRLACQLALTGGSVRVERLVPPFITPAELHASKHRADDAQDAQAEPAE